jgi:hypothetical protein
LYDQLRREIIADFASFLLDFNQYRDLSIEFSESRNVSNIKIICSVGAAVFHAGGHTDMRKLIIASASCFVSW